MLGIAIWTDAEEFMNTGKLKRFASGLINSTNSTNRILYEINQI